MSIREIHPDQKRRKLRATMPMPVLPPIERRPFDIDAARDGAADGAFGDGTAGAR